MKRSEEIRKQIKSYERDKFVIERDMKRELDFVNKTLARLNRELTEIRDGGKLDEEI